ncbi:MAG: GNAT family N-acetyltransferase [Arenicellales bacterium]|jgi:GNAT superfamily N-acetyltransferase
MIEVIDADLSQAGHADIVVRLMDEYARDPMGGGKALPGHVRRNLVVELRKRETAHVIIGLVDGEAAGLAVCFEGFSTFACRPLLNIHDVVVSARHRGKGVSRRMLERAEAIARELGCCKLTLEVLEGNTVAQAAYRAVGFAGYELDPTSGKALFWEKKLTAP